MDTKELKAIIEEVLAEMNVSEEKIPEEEKVKKEVKDEVKPIEEEPKADVTETTAQEESAETNINPNEADYEEIIEDGSLEDITAIDIKDQYLVKNPLDREGFYELKQFAPCRLGIGKAGARYNTLPQLMFRAAHSAAQDAVFSDVDQDFVDNLDLFTKIGRAHV